MTSFAQDLFNMEVVIVGAGVAGASAALYLARAGVKNIFVLECGMAGKGAPQGRPLVDWALVRDGDVDIDDTQKTAFPFARKSGTATFDDPDTNNVSAMKMILNVFPCSTREFIANHGIEGAKRYLKLAKKGVELEKKLGYELLSDSNDSLKALGSVYVCKREEITEFQEEFESLSQLIIGTDIRIEWWEDEEKVRRVSGSELFVRAIFFPDDAVIDSAAYSRVLLMTAKKEGGVTLVENCPSVTGIDTINGHAITQLQDGTHLKSKHVVLATGGLFLEKNLAGILIPCWSYLVSIKESSRKESSIKESSEVESEATVTDGLQCIPTVVDRLQSPDSPNFFTWKVFFF